MSDQINTKTQFDDIERLLCRSELYKALACYYRHPSLVDMNNYSNEQKESLDDAITQLRNSNKEKLRTSMKALIHESISINLQEWILLYENCFSHTAHGTVSSYELEYGEEHTHRQPQQLGDIAAFYNAFGLRLNKNRHERVDHISIECEFMHFLSFKEAYALERGNKDGAEICRQASCRFLTEHLGRWAPSFALRLSRHIKVGLFKHLADFTFGFISEDCNAQGIKPGSSNLPIRSVNENYDSGCVTCSLKPGFQTS